MQLINLWYQCIGFLDQLCLQIEESSILGYRIWGGKPLHRCNATVTRSDELAIRGFIRVRKLTFDLDPQEAL